MPKPRTVDEYLDALPAEQRAALQKVRRTIRAAAPGATEYIGYGLAGFKLDGRPLIYFGAAKAHLALYGGAVTAFTKDLKGYDVSKGTLRFTPEKPLPAALVTKIVKASVVRIRSKE